MCVVETTSSGPCVWTTATSLGAQRCDSDSNSSSRQRSSTHASKQRCCLQLLQLRALQEAPCSLLPRRAIKLCQAAMLFLRSMPLLCKQCSDPCTCSPGMASCWSASCDLQHISSLSFQHSAVMSSSQ